MKPRAASSADSTPSDAPQAHASLVILGSAHDRIIGAIGAWYSARPSAEIVALGSSPSRRALAAATPMAPHAPEAWYA